MLEGHTQNVNGVAFAPDGRTLVSVSYDQSIRIWPLSSASAPTVVAMPSPLNAVAIGGDGEIVAGGADGKLYFLSGTGVAAGEIAAGPKPVISIAISPDGALLAAAGIGGSVAVIDRKARALARTLIGPGLPVWSVAFLPDSRTLLTGGADNIIRRWDAVTGDTIDPLLLETAGDPLAAYAGDHGAEVFRACVACHTLNAEQANKAGPTLAGIFGRRIATLPGYHFSEGLKRLDIVINSAAIMVHEPVETVTPESWDGTLDLNLRATFFVSQGAIPHLRRAKGKIVNMADIAGMEPWPAYVPHCVSKAGVIMLTKALARALAPASHLPSKPRAQLAPVRSAGRMSWSRSAPRRTIGAERPARRCGT